MKVKQKSRSGKDGEKEIRERLIIVKINESKDIGIEPIGKRDVEAPANVKYRRKITSFTLRQKDIGKSRIGDTATKSKVVSRPLL